MGSGFRGWIKNGESNRRRLWRKVFPLVFSRVSQELAKNRRAIAVETGISFLEAYQGKTQPPGIIRRLWEIPLSSSPLEVAEVKLVLGSLVVGYQFPPGTTSGQLPEPEDPESFLQSRVSVFEDLFRDLSCDRGWMEDLTEEVVCLVYRDLQGGGEKSRQAHPLWEKPVTTRGGTRNLGRIVVAYQPPLPPEDHTPPVSATGSGENT